MYGAIHGRCLQLNASIHNYSLSISCSPRCLVVVFSSFSLQKKNAIKDGQKQAGAQTLYLEMEEKKKEQLRNKWKRKCSSPILQHGFRQHSKFLHYITLIQDNCHKILHSLTICAVTVFIENNIPLLRIPLLKSLQNITWTTENQILFCYTDNILKLFSILSCSLIKGK